MKAFTFVSTLLAAVSAAPSPEVAGEIVPTRLHKRFVDPVNPALYKSTEQGVKVLPRFSATSPKDGATRTTISYGSWMVSSSKMLSTGKVGRGPCPITTGCYVTAMEATIVYPDGTEANVDTGSWLHHIALFGTGGGTGSIWASGNERPTLRLNTQQKYGFEFPSMFMLIIDLMRDDTTLKNLTLQITYEWVPKSASGYKGTRMYWLTIGEPAAKKGQYKFTTMPMLALGSGPLLYTIGHMHDAGTDMRLYIDGKLVCKSIMHYGNPAKGTFTPDGGAAPVSAASVGAAPAAAPASKSSGLAGLSGLSGLSGLAGLLGGKGAAAPAASAPAAAAPAANNDAHSAMDMSGMAGMNMKRQEHSHAMGSGEHIIAPGACTDFGTLATGSRMTAEAYYDANLHPLMEMNGKQENLMGNMRVYVGDSGSSSGGLGSLFGLKK